MARAHAQLSAVALALVGLAACQLVAGIEDLVPAPDAGSPAVDAAPAPTVAENGCPRGRGPDMVRLGALCIDTTEVTREQYDEFLRDDAGAQPPGCTWNKSFVPGEKTGTPPLCLSTFPRAPVGCVDFCDATMFCLWAKKELCGGPKGGTANFADPGNPTTSAWALACNGGEAARAYPYGSTYEPRSCNGKDQGANGVVSAGTLSACTRPDSGVYDMSGNVWEWENATAPGDGGGPAGDLACLRGGSHTDEGPRLRCDTQEAQPRDFQQYNVGFRCCAQAK